MGCPKTSFHHSRSRALQWPDGTSKAIPVDTLKVELQYYYCRQDKVYSRRECKQSPVCTSVQFQLLWQILSSRESWWQQVSRFWALRPKQYETKKVWSNVRKGLRNFLLSPASSIGRRATPTAWSHVGWSWFKKKKRFTSQASAYSPNTPWRILGHCVYQGQLNQSAETSLLK